MKYQRLPKWLLHYKKKMRNAKLRPVLLFFACIFICIISFFLHDAYRTENTVSTIGCVCAVFAYCLLVFNIFQLCYRKMRYRKYNNSFVCVYHGLIKKMLIIDNEIQDSAFSQEYYYGQLPDGTQVTVKCNDGNIQFAFGDSQNLNLTQF